MKRHWYSIEARGGIGEVFLFDEIGAFGVSAKQFVEDLKKLSNVAQIRLRINSIGGSVFDGAAMYNAIRQHKAHVTASIEGIAASMASVVAMAADRVEMAANGLLMIHNPHGMTMGDANAHRKTADALDKASQTLVNAYVVKTGKDADAIAAMMDDETWFTAEEALEHGFVDEVTGAVEAAASLDLSGLNPPDWVRAILGQQQEGVVMTKRAAAQGGNINGITADQFHQQEQQRRRDIRGVFGTFADEHRALLDECLDDFGCTVDQARARLLDAIGRDSEPLNAGREPRIYAGPDRLQEFRAAAVDALLIRNGVHVDQPHPAARDLQRMGLSAMAETILRQHGRATAGLNHDGVIKAALHSTGDFPDLLANVANKSLQIGYEEQESSHRVWTREVEVPDFKEASFPQLSEFSDLDEIPEGGEYKLGTFDDSAERLAIATYGKLFAITRQALINDDLNAFTRLPRAFGAAARRKEADLVYAVLTSNPNMADGNALFSVAHGNVAASGSALSVVSLGEARAAMRKQKGSQGLATLNVRPRYLIVPAALETTAEELISSLVNPARTNDTENLSFVRSLELVVDARLDEDSATQWYLVAAPRAIETVVVAHLQGRDVFSTDTKTGWEVDGVEFKVRLDAAAKALDWRGMFRNPGA